MINSSKNSAFLNPEDYTEKLTVWGSDYPIFQNKISLKQIYNMKGAFRFKTYKNPHSKLYKILYVILCDITLD